VEIGPTQGAAVAGLFAAGKAGRNPRFLPDMDGPRPGGRGLQTREFRRVGCIAPEKPAFLVKSAQNYRLPGRHVL
jgi:hypothetical protein